MSKLKQLGTIMMISVWHVMFPATAAPESVVENAVLQLWDFMEPSGSVEFSCM